MLGDFIEILCSDDKYGGRNVNINRALEFKECLDTCNLLDLGFLGPKFIWSNLRQISNLILERIDRCFVNPEWRLTYPEALVTHLPWVFSNHCPVLVKLSRPLPTTINKPFRFHTMWLLHLEFLGLLKTPGSKNNLSLKLFPGL